MSARISGPRPQRPLQSLKRKGQRQGLTIIRANNFAGFKDKDDDMVVILSGDGNRLTDPLSLDDADIWLYQRGRRPLS